MLRSGRSRTLFGFSFSVRVLLVAMALLLAAGLLVATTSDSEAQGRGFTMPRIPRVSPPRVPRVVVPRTPSVVRKVPRITAPKLPKPAREPRKLTAPVVGSPKKPVIPPPSAANKQLPAAAMKQLPAQPTALTKQAKPAGAAPKSDQWGWSDCRSKGGVWGANGSCGSPKFAGTQGQGPRLVPIPWFVPIVPHKFVDPLPCPQGFKQVGETFYGGTRCAPVAPAAQERELGFAQAAAAHTTVPVPRPQSQRICADRRVAHTYVRDGRNLQGETGIQNETINYGNTLQPVTWGQIGPLVNHPRVQAAIRRAMSRAESGPDWREEAIIVRRVFGFWLPQIGDDAKNTFNHADPPRGGARCGVLDIHLHRPGNTTSGDAPSDSDIEMMNRRRIPQLIIRGDKCILYGAVPANWTPRGCF